MLILEEQVEVPCGKLLPVLFVCLFVVVLFWFGFFFLIGKE